MKVSALNRTEASVVAHLDRQHDALVALLRRLLGFRTITPGEGMSAEGKDYVELVAFVRGLLEQIGVDNLTVWEQDGAQLDTFPGSGVSANRNLSAMPILVAEFKGTGEGRSLILNGHYDVVPTGEISKWEHDPFEGKQIGSKIFGRGACDMKGGIAAMLIALQAINALGLRLSGDVLFELVPDEEMTCMGTLAACQRGYRADAALIPEPTDMQVLIAMRGSFYGQVNIPGRAGHAEMTQPEWQEGGAVNAINKAQILLEAFDDLNSTWSRRSDRQHPLIGPDAVVPTGISGGSDWAVTYPDQVTISFGVMTSSSVVEVREEMEQFVLREAARDPWLQAHPPEFTYDPVWHYPAEVDPEEPIVRLGIDVLKNIGFIPQVCGMGSLTDAIHLINYSKIPTISIGPGGQPAHMLDEYVVIDELVALTKVIALILLRWCGVEDG